ncbi:MAG TPA: beta-ketoacyl synthase N-terminal-like domain-containing protein, partial [Dongiaceae bacterium]|nr:beta-ketoacyl synthase N-terminal-like domain-containing protein [Dongiaceae bacterium]
MTRRVVVTGIGCISALGPTTREFWAALRDGRSGIAPMRSVEPGMVRFPNGAEVRDFDPATHFEAKQLDLLDRFAQLALVSAREAVRDSGLAWTPALRQRTAVISGCAVGGQASQEVQFVELYRNNRGRVHPLTIPRVMSSAGTSAVAMEFGFTGPAFSVSSACSSASHAIAQALMIVRCGQADVAVTGGSEAPFGYASLKAWDA